jgi:hypothetical protein
MMQRPTVVTVFGILNIIFGALGLVSIPMSILVLFVLRDTNNPMMQIIQGNAVYRTWMMASLPMSLVATILLVVAGIGLMMMKPWARVISIGYGIYTIVMGIVGMIFNGICLMGPLMSQAGNAPGPEAIGAMGGAVGGTFGGCFGLVYPVLLLIFMTRPGVVEAFRPLPVGRILP